jgi:2-C-methyl-D-erythritol 4-phosphate cytidylyltransferase
MNFAVILAAGQGKRFGREKQFVLINNKPVIYYSIQKFNQSPVIDKIIIVTLKNYIPFLRQLVKKYKFDKVSDIIVGGAQRQDSVKNVLRVLPEKGYVAIHDAARPNFKSKLVSQGFRMVSKTKACIPVIPVQDTIKIAEKNSIKETLDRKKLYIAQTPQFFDVELLKNAYDEVYQEQYYASDDANLIERLGRKVYTIAGSKQNIKITDKEDLPLIKVLLCKK